MVRSIALIGLFVCVVGGAAVWLTAGTALHAAQDATQPTSIDYQKAADSATWDWRAEDADPLGCLEQCEHKYDIRLLSKKDDRLALTFTILAGGKDVFTWEGHRHSVFRILGDRLYYAEFNTHDTGGNVVAVDLKTGKKLWTSPLKAVEVDAHSKYFNFMDLQVDDEVVTIRGNELGGRYIEYKSVATGETIGHKVFPKSTTEQ